MGLRISSEVLAAIIAESEKARAWEVCGLLVGDATYIVEHLVCRNVASDPSRAFEIDPTALIVAHKAARRGGPQIVGCYHSHPSGLAEPSLRDARAASADGALWLIVAGRAVGLWRAVERGERHGRFDRIAFKASPRLAPTRRVSQSDVMKKGFQT